MSIEITIKLGSGRAFNATLDEAKELRKKLAELLGPEAASPMSPCFPPNQIPWVGPQSGVNPFGPPAVVYCGSEGGRANGCAGSP